MTGYNVCAECGSSLDADDSNRDLCDFCEERERREYGPSPCDCEIHQTMTTDQAWSTLP